MKLYHNERYQAHCVEVKSFLSSEINHIHVFDGFTSEDLKEPFGLEWHTSLSWKRLDHGRVFQEFCRHASYCVVKQGMENLPSVPCPVFSIPYVPWEDHRLGPEDVDSLKRKLNKEALIGRHLIGIVGEEEGLGGDFERELYEKSGAQWKSLSIPLTPFSWELLQICDCLMLSSELDPLTAAWALSVNKPVLVSVHHDLVAEQVLKSGGGLLYTDSFHKKKQCQRLCLSEGLRMELGGQLKEYLEGEGSAERACSSYRSLQKSIYACISKSTEGLCLAQNR